MSSQVLSTKKVKVKQAKCHISLVLNEVVYPLKVIQMIISRSMETQYQGHIKTFIYSAYFKYVCDLC